MQLSPDQLERLNNALASAFTPNAYARAVKFDLGVPLANIAASGTHLDQVFEVVEWVISQGRLGEYFAKTRERNPGNPQLIAFEKDLARRSMEVHLGAAHDLQGLLITSPNVDSQTACPGSTDALEALAWAGSVGVPLKQWLDGLQISQGRVCVITRNGSAWGTGFLVGPAHVITNHHVIPAHSSDQYAAVFDWHDGADWKNLPSYPAVFQLAWSPEKELDYMIVKLDRTPAGNRGYYEPLPEAFVLRESMQVVQHPGGGPMRIASGIIADINSQSQRLAYTANTLGGASGSPIFNSRWQVLGIHHHGEQAVNNHGIPMKSILAATPNLFNEILVS